MQILSTVPLALGITFPEPARSFFALMDALSGESGSKVGMFVHSLPHHLTIPSPPDPSFAALRPHHLAISALNPLTWVSAACVNAEFAAFDTNVILSFGELHSVGVLCVFAQVG